MSSGLDSVLNLVTSKPATGLLGLGVGGLVYLVAPGIDHSDPSVPDAVRVTMSIVCFLLGGAAGLVLGYAIAASRDLWNRNAEARRVRIENLKKAEYSEKRLKYVQQCVTELSEEQKSFLQYHFVGAGRYKGSDEIPRYQQHIAIELERKLLGEFDSGRFFIDSDFMKEVLADPDSLDID